MPFRYPDQPARAIPYASLLEWPGLHAYQCQLKIDGWRCVVECDNGRFTYTSRHNKPLEVPEYIRGTFERVTQERLGASFTLDCELTGKREQGQAEAIFVFDVWSIGGRDYTRECQAVRAYTVAANLPEYSVPFSPQVVSGDERAVREEILGFVEAHKNNPLAEGVVLKLWAGSLICSPIRAGSNTGWIKCKWRNT